MDVIQSLAVLETDAVVKVAYLVGRYLTHGLNDAAFKNSVKAGNFPKTNDGALKLSLQIVRAIEDREGKKIRDLSQDIRRSYLAELGSVSRNVTLDAANPSLLRAAEAELSAFRNGT